MRRNVVLLAACQALLVTGVVVLVSTSALVGKHLAPVAAYSTIPLAIYNVVVMVVALPAAMLMKRIGRRRGFILGGAVGTVGASVAALGVARSDFGLFCGGLAVLGVFMAFGGYYRFAAAEVVAPEHRSRAIGYVIGGGVVAALASSQLSALTRGVGGLPEFSGSYVLVACAAALTVVLVSFLDVPKPTQEECVRCGRPLASIVRQPDYIVAVAAASLGYFAMALIMAATPLAMESSAFTFGTIAFVFQWHVVAMFAPSFGTGPLIARIGVVRVLALGVTLMVACVVINLLGRSEAFFWFALVLLGLGWNFLYVGGTALLTTTYRPEERAKSQGFNDLVVYAAITLAALATGEIDTLWGWRGINLSAAPAIAVVTGCVAWLAARTRRAEGAAPD